MKTSPHFLKFAFSLICIFFISTLISAQEVSPLEEGDIPPVVIVKHFKKYPNCTVSQWGEIKQNGTKLFVADFIFQGNKGTAAYNSNGKIEQEIQYFQNTVPAHLYEYFESNYTKFKLVEVKRIENYTSGLVYYEAAVKTKEKGTETLRFDHQQNIQPSEGMLALKN